MKDEKSLAHYGVLGMRWGRRSGSSKTSGSNKSSKSVNNKPAVTKNKLSKGKLLAASFLVSPIGTLAIAKFKRSWVEDPGPNSKKETRKLSVGKTLAASMLLSPLGAVAINKLNPSLLRKDD